MEPIGEVTGTLVLAEVACEVTAIVIKGCPQPMILGMGFLTEHLAKIDLEHNLIQVTVDGIKINLDTQSYEGVTPACHAYNTPPTKVRIAEDYLLRPSEEREVRIDATLSAEDAVSYKFKPNESFMIKKGLYIGHRLRVKDNGNIVVKIKNLRFVPQRLFERTNIGSLELARVTHQCVCTAVVSDNASAEIEYDVSTTLEVNERESLINLLREYRDVFAADTSEMGYTDLVEHIINVEEAAPIKIRPYRVSQKEREIIDEQIQEMLQYGVIRPSSSPWASPIVLVKKKDGKTRFCVDYRQLNSVTRKDCYPLPNIDDILTYVGKAKYFSTLDLFSGYWQVGIREECKAYTSFVVSGGGSYEFNKLPFGLCNAPATFQMLVDKLFHDMKWKEILCYLDDIVVFSATFEEHLARLRGVFERLRFAGLTLKGSKCFFVQEKVKLLGHVVSSTGLAPDEDKLDAISKFPQPRSVKDIQSFLGLCNYYRKFIRNFSIIARPMYEATRKDLHFEWNETLQGVFDLLKEVLVNAPVLAHFDNQAPTELHVDASRIGIGAVLLQTDEEGKAHPIAYVSRSLTKAEKNYGISELEALGVVWSLGYLRHLIYGRPVRILTDHAAICYLKNVKNPTGRLAR